MISIGIIGGTGYTGVELLRLLSRHPSVQIKTITSRTEAGKSVSALFPNLPLDLTYSDPATTALDDCDVVFCAAPNGIAMNHAEALLASGVKVIDLAADFRFSDADLWSSWYGMPHACADLLPQAVYGLPEYNRAQIKSASLVGNPGCYPTAVSLGLLPFLEAGVIDAEHIIADCKSGISGAGRSATVSMLQAESSENFKAYATGGHRHEPEITHNLSKLSGQSVAIHFMPHLLPMIRGIYATIYAPLTQTLDNPADILRARYVGEPFVSVSDTAPETRWVRGSNHCQIAAEKKGDTLVIFSAIDNLVKGAAGQAVQNMNLMCALPETTGLKQIALMP